MNQATLTGHVGGDPDIRNLPNGTATASFTLATTERWKDRNTGERKERTEWHRIAAFGNICQVIEGYVRKGTQLLIQGQIRTRKWQDQSGQDRYTTEIVINPNGGKLELLGGKPKGDARGGPPDDGSNGGYGGGPNGGQASNQGGGRSAYDELDDEIPFAPCWEV